MKSLFHKNSEIMRIAMSNKTLDFKETARVLLKKVARVI